MIFLRGAQKSTFHLFYLSKNHSHEVRTFEEDFLGKKFIKCLSVSSFITAKLRELFEKKKEKCIQRMKWSEWKWLLNEKMQSRRRGILKLQKWFSQRRRANRKAIDFCVLVSHEQKRNGTTRIRQATSRFSSFTILNKYCDGLHSDAQI